MVQVTISVVRFLCKRRLN